MSSSTVASGEAAARAWSNPEVLAILVIFVVVLLGAILVPWMGDVFRSYTSRENTAAVLQTLLKTNPELGKGDSGVAFAKEFLDSPNGIEGLGRMVLAIAVLTVIGLVLIFLVITDGSNGMDIAKTILTALTAALTTIVGFYFGSRATQDGTGSGTGAKSSKPGNGGNGGEGEGKEPMAKPQPEAPPGGTDVAKKTEAPEAAAAETETVKGTLSASELGNVGDRVVVQSERIGQTPRQGEILKVLDAGEGVHYTVRWDNGHESEIFPGGGSITIVPKATTAAVV